MKKELPPIAILGAIAAGVLALVVVFIMAGGTGKPTAKDKQEWEDQANVARSRNEAYATGQSAPGGAPSGQPGQGSAEFQARQKAQSGGN